MRGPIDSKSNTCTESMEVDAAGISGKVDVHYPGRSGLSAHWDYGRREAMGRASEVSRGHSRFVEN